MQQSQDALQNVFLIMYMMHLKNYFLAQICRMNLRFNCIFTLSQWRSLNIKYFIWGMWGGGSGRLWKGGKSEQLSTN